MLFFGKYIILFQGVIRTFSGVFFVGVPLVFAFACSFFMLLYNRDNFQTLNDSMMKTWIMLSGEFNYEDIFFKENPPRGFSEDWDMGYEHVPFPIATYTLFIVFYFLASMVALNVLVGLIVDATFRNFVEMADLRMMSMRLYYMLGVERSYAWRLWRKLSLLRVKNRNEKEAGQIEVEMKTKFQMGHISLMSLAKVRENLRERERMKKEQMREETINYATQGNPEFKKLVTDVMEMKKEMTRLARTRNEIEISSVVQKWRGKKQRKQ